MYRTTFETIGILKKLIEDTFSIPPSGRGPAESHFLDKYAERSQY